MHLKGSLGILFQVILRTFWGLSPNFSFKSPSEQSQLKLSSVPIGWEEIVSFFPLYDHLVLLFFFFLFLFFPSFSGSHCPSRCSHFPASSLCTSRLKGPGRCQLVDTGGGESGHEAVAGGKAKRPLGGLGLSGEIPGYPAIGSPWFHLH